MKDEEVTALMKAVYDGGVRHFDTAEVYKTGNPIGDAPEDKWNEKQMAPFLASVPRDTYTVASKYMPLKYKGKCDYETVKKALQGSLKRLGLKKLDLYYSHRVLSEDGCKEFMAAIKKLKG